MSDHNEPKASSVNGAFTFALCFFALAVLLLFNIEEQTRWVPGKALTSQPRFWPTVTLGIMAFFGALHFLSTLVGRPKFDGGKEWIEWVKAIEFALWFGSYSALVPIIGYLFATLLACVLLGWRLGYRSRKQIATAFLCGLTIVVFFRVILGIHIPAGALYHKFPAPVSTFMMDWF